MSWTPPTNDGGALVQNYIVEKRNKTSSTWVRCSRHLVCDINFRCTCLQEKNEYEFRVAAENKAGVGPYCDPTEYILIKDPVFVPNANNPPSIQGTTASSISICWQPPMQDGGAPIDYYKAYMKEPNSEESNWEVIPGGHSINAQKITATKLAADKSYIFAVSSVNKMGESEKSSASIAVQPKEITEAPNFDLEPEYRSGITIRSGKQLNLSVILQGKPLPSIKWYKDNNEITDERVYTEVVGNIANLVIDNIELAEGGKYEFTLENNMGEKSGFINVRVISINTAIFGVF